MTFSDYFHFIRHRMLKGQRFGVSVGLSGFPQVVTQTPNAVRI
jgi:hypothetical protein